MTRASALLRLAAAGALALSLGGCISLLPKSKPAQLYRFGEAPAAAASPAPTAPAASQVGVFWGGGAFQRESSGDRLLTITGERAAYIAQVRWVAPAQVLFDQAVQAAFEAAPGHVRLVPRGAPSVTDFVLRLDMRNFETRYENGPKAAPTVLVRAHASLTRGRAATQASEQVFEARAPAADNRVGAIVAAYDTALGEVLGQAVAWTNENAR